MSRPETVEQESVPTEIGIPSASKSNRSISVPSSHPRASRPSLSFKDSAPESFSVSQKTGRSTIPSGKDCRYPYHGEFCPRCLPLGIGSSEEANRKIGFLQFYKQCQG